MSDKVELKGCPFCGGVARGKHLVHGPGYMAFCDNDQCGVYGMYVDRGTWNTRPDVAALQTALQEAEGERDEAVEQRKTLGGKSYRESWLDSIAEIAHQYERAEEAERKLTDLRGTVADFMDKNDALADKLALAVEGIRDAISLFHTYNYGKPTAPSIINTHLNSVVSQLEADK